MLICNVILTTLCLTVLYGQAFMVILPARALEESDYVADRFGDLFRYYEGAGTDWSVSDVSETCTGKIRKYAGKLKLHK